MKRRHLGWLAAAVTCVTPLVGSASNSFSSTGNLVTPRYYATATMLPTGLVLIAGGNNGSSILANAELYNPSTGVFTETGSLNVARESASATLLPDGQVLILGGVNISGELASAELYNPSSGTFTAVSGALSTARRGAVAALLGNGQVMIAGGMGTAGALASVEIYDPESQMFSTSAAVSLATAREFATGAVLDTGDVVVAGGYSGTGALASVEVYKATLGKFVSGGTLSSAKYQATSTLLNNGSLLIAGGLTSTGAVATADLYNPSTGTVAATGALTTPRYGAAASLLGNGMVLLAGGVTTGTVFTATAEIYDPVAGKFAATGALTTAREFATATRLPNGNVLVAGGYGGTNSTSTANVFTPASLSPPSLVSIVVSPSTVNMLPGRNQLLLATGTFTGGTTQQLESVTWSSSSATVAAVANDASNEGQVLGATPGTATVKACAGTVCGSSTISVLIPPSITSATASAAVGKTLTIAGQGFGSAVGTVVFNQLSYTPPASDWTAGSIQFAVPASWATVSGSPTGTPIAATVVVVPVAGGQSNAAPFEVLPTPSLLALPFSTGTTGSQITVSGTGFGAAPGTIAFGGVAATAIVSWGPTAIAAVIPAGAKTGVITVTNSSGISGSSAQGFTVVAVPTVSPTSAAIGATVTLTGTGFGTVVGSVTIGGAAATVVAGSWTANSIQVVVPANAPLGNEPVVVISPSSQFVGVSLQVLAAPKVGSVLLGGAAAYQSAPTATIVINGSNFGTTAGTVSFGATKVAVVAASWTATSITVAVPSSVGSTTVAVNASGTTSNAFPFAVVAAPKLVSLAPVAAAPGMQITVVGQSLGSVPGTVLLAGVSVQPLYWNAAGVSFLIPATATLGANESVTVKALGVISNALTVALNKAAATVIVGVVPNPAPVNASIAINLSSVGAGNPTVTIGGQAAAAVANGNTITTTVPGTLAAGINNVVVKWGATVTPPFPLMVRPQILGISFKQANSPGVAALTGPAEVEPDPVGTVTAGFSIYGTNFGAAQGTGTATLTAAGQPPVPLTILTAGGVAGAASSWSNTSILVQIPAALAQPAQPRGLSTLYTVTVAVPVVVNGAQQTVPSSDAITFTITQAIDCP